MWSMLEDVMQRIFRKAKSRNDLVCSELVTGLGSNGSLGLDRFLRFTIQV